MIGGPDGTFANYRRSDQSINFLDRLNPCPDNTHPLHNTRPLPGTAMDSIIYNTVILAAGASHLGDHQIPGPLAAGLATIVLVGEGNARSEEHTSELQSLRHLVCRL